MTTAAAHAAAAVVCRRVVASDAFAAAPHVAAYVAADGEIDPSPVLLAAIAAGKGAYYPRVSGDTLEFLAGDPVTFRRGFGAIVEPAGGRPLPDDGDVLFLVPGVGFDLLGARLGRGGGHYDRFLPARSRATRIGLAFEFQVLPRLPEEPWDVRMQFVATDARMIPGAAS